jgi:drug/metabolite transporter (DMT)-like permease
MRIRLVAVWCLACLLWSTTFLFIRVGVTEIRPFTLAWMRLALALAVLTPIALLRADLRTLHSTDVRRVAAAGLLLLGVNYSLLFWGAQFVPSGPRGHCNRRHFSRWPRLHVGQELWTAETGRH